MVKCGVCGAENEAEALFCGVCGSRLTPEVAETLVTEAEAEATAAGGDADIVIPRSGGPGRVPGDEEASDDTTVGPGDGGAETVSVVGGSVTCAVCGTVNDATRTYCRKCATELRPKTAPPPPPPPPTERRGPPPLVLALGGVAVLLVVVVALVMSGILGPGPIAEASPTPAPPTSGPTTPPTGAPETDAPTPTAPVITEGDVPPGRIVFSRCPAGGGVCELVIRNADGSGGNTRLTGSPQGARDPGFSNDATRIAYSTTAGLRILTLQPGFPWVQATSNSSDANAYWGPDDASIVFSRVQAQSREIRILDVGTGESRRITNNTVEDHDAVFTPDGRSLIWVQGTGDDRELMRLDLDTGNVAQLTDDGFDDVDPVVSPDGSRLAFVSKREAGDAFELFVMDLATLQVTRLLGVDGDVHDPDWSPGGRYLVVSAGPAGNRDILIYDTLTKRVITLTRNADNDLAPGWR